MSRADPPIQSIQSIQFETSNFGGVCGHPKNLNIKRARHGAQKTAREATSRPFFFSANFPLTQLELREPEARNNHNAKKAGRWLFKLSPSLPGSTSALDPQTSMRCDPGWHGGSWHPGIDTGTGTRHFSRLRGAESVATRHTTRRVPCRYRVQPLDDNDVPLSIATGPAVFCPRSLHCRN